MLEEQVSIRFPAPGSALERDTHSGWPIPAVFVEGHHQEL
jgi:hypothetical protein